VSTTRASVSGAIDLGRIRPFVDAFSPQNYWTDFQRPEPDVMEQYDALAYGLPLWPMLPANSTAEATDDALQRIERIHAGESVPIVSVFQRTSLNNANLDVFKRHSVMPNETGGSSVQPDVDAAAYEAAYWGPLYNAGPDPKIAAALRATGNHGDAILADEVEKAAQVLDETARMAAAAQNIIDIANAQRGDALVFLQRAVAANKSLHHVE
jgi:hypothetical protein